MGLPLVSHVLQTGSELEPLVLIPTRQLRQGGKLRLQQLPVLLGAPLD
jgi:hypothetical protein